MTCAVRGSTDTGMEEEATNDAHADVGSDRRAKGERLLTTFHRKPFLLEEADRRRGVVVIPPRAPTSRALSGPTSWTAPIVSGSGRGRCGPPT